MAEPLAEVTALLERYDAALSRAGRRDTGLRLPGASWFRTVFVSRRVRRVLEDLRGRYRRDAATRGNAESAHCAAITDDFLGGVPDPHGQKTVPLVLFVVFALVLPAVAGIHSGQLLAVASAVVSLDGSAAVAALEAVDPGVLSSSLIGVTVLLALVAAVPAWSFRHTHRILSGASGASGGSTLAAERVVYRQFDEDPRAGPQWDILALGVMMLAIVVNALFIGLETNDYAWSPWLVLVAAIGALLAAVLHGSVRSREPQPSRGVGQRLAVAGAAATALVLLPAVAADRFGDSQSPYFVLQAVTLKAQGLELADFADATGFVLSKRNFEGLSLADYLKDAGAPSTETETEAATEADREADREADMVAVAGVTVSYGGLSTGSFTCDCELVAGLYDARTAQPLSAKWASSHWPLVVAAEGSREVSGAVWLPTPRSKGTYFVRLEIVERIGLTDPATVPPNRTLTGPFEIVLSNGDVDGVFYQQLKPLDAFDSESFTIS